VANLLLARGAAREREMAIRAALGATSARIARQLLTECIVLAVPSGIIGAVAGMLSIGQVLRILPGTLPRLAEHGSRLSVHWPVFAFTALLCIVTAIVFGLVPAFHAVRAGLMTALRASAGQSSRQTNRLRSTLVVTQMALTVVLLVGAGLLGRSFVRLSEVKPGFRTQHVVVLDASIPYERGAKVPRESFGMEARDSGRHSVGAAAAFPPMLGRYGVPFSIAGRPAASVIAEVDIARYWSCSRFPDSRTDIHRA
jgi:hypothetical protein